MKCGLLPRGMWLIFRKSFRRQLCLITREDPQAVMKKARTAYRSILFDIPDFDKDDRFLVNILSAAMLAAVYLNLQEKPELSAMTTYYHKAMTKNTVMKHFLKHSDSYSEKAQAKLARQARQERIRIPGNSGMSLEQTGTAIPAISIPAGSGICFKRSVSRKSHPQCAPMTMTWRN